MTADIAGETRDKDYQIVVNGEHKTVESDTLTFDQVVAIAYPSPDHSNIYSVTFEKAVEPKEGELLRGQTVIVKNGTEFDVELTGKS